MVNHKAKVVDQICAGLRDIKDMISPLETVVERQKKIAGTTFWGEHEDLLYGMGLQKMELDRLIEKVGEIESDLLDACKKAYNVLHGDRHGNELAEHILLEAIAKAEGRE